MAKDDLLTVRIASGELQKIDRAARASKQSRSDFTRFVCLHAAEAVLASELTEERDGR